MAGAPLPVRCWDGSGSGPADAAAAVVYAGVTVTGIRRLTEGVRVAVPAKRTS
jgi:hypothetical protein